MAEGTTSLHDQFDFTIAKLSPVDAIIASEVLRDALNKFRLLQSLAPKIDEHQEAITSYVSKEIERIIKKQDELEKQFQEQIQQRDEAISANESRDVIQKLNNIVQDLASQIQESTRQLCKNLKENPSVTQNLEKTQKHRDKYLELVKDALDEIVAHESYTDLEKQISEQYIFLQEFNKQQEREQQALQEKNQLLQKIVDQKNAHVQMMEDNQKKLDILKEDLQHEKERVSQCLNLLRIELQSSNDEIGRLRIQELELQENKYEVLLNQIKNQQFTDAQAIYEIQADVSEINNLATQAQTNRDKYRSVLENEKNALQQKADEAEKKIKDLEEQCRRNRQEKKDWEEAQAFKARMGKATHEARKMRLEMFTRPYLKAEYEDSLCTTKNRKNKGKSKIK